MRDQRRKGWADWMLYAVGRCVMAMVLALPWHTARSVAGFLGVLAYVLDRPTRRKSALADLRRAFPDYDEAQARRVLRGVYRRLVESIVDSLNFVRFAGRWQPEGLFETVGFDKLRTVRNGQGVIFVTGHFGYWEALGAASPLLGYPVWSMGRRLPNAYLDSYVRRLRQATGQRVLDKQDGLRTVIRLLRRGENVALLIDQDVRREGIFVDFFGRPACTTSTPARLAMRTGAPVAFVYACRVPGKNRLRMVVKDVIVPSSPQDRTAEAHRITQQLTSDLEEVVRQAPEDWLWLHRRWKTFPGKYGPR